MRKVYFVSTIIAASILIIVIINSCRHAEITSLADLRTVYFNEEILPIFVTQCGSSRCHGGSNEKRMNYTTYNGIMTGITPGQPYNSKIYTAIIGVYLNSMPPGKPINENQRTLIKVWIEQGAKNNSESDTITKKDTTKTIVPVGSACFSRDILPVILANCSKCHNSLTSYNGIIQIVSAGNPSNSTLYQDITASGSNAMPPSYKLPQVNIDSIYSWIKNGATNGTCSVICDTTLYNFGAQVMPIFNTNCIGCHSGSSPQGNILLDDYTSITAAVNNGKLLSSLKNKTMPPISPLTECKTTVIEKWINSGAKDN